MPFCVNCGSPVAGRFCSTCGAAAFYPPPVAGKFVLEDNIAAALCYLPIFAIAALACGLCKRNRVIRFNALQSLFWVMGLVVINAFLAALGVNLPRDLLMAVVWLGIIPMAIKAYQGNRFHMPVIGHLAEAMS